MFLLRTRSINFSALIQKINPNTHKQQRHQQGGQITVGYRNQRCLRKPPQQHTHPDAQQPVPVLIDAAHNPHGAQALAVALPQNFSFPDGLCLVLGAFADKDTTQVFEILAPLAQKIIFTPVTSERSLSVTALREHAQQLADQGYEVSVCADAAAAFAAAYEWAREKPGTRGVLVAGSVLLAGAALSYARAEKW